MINIFKFLVLGKELIHSLALEGVNKKNYVVMYNYKSRQIFKAPALALFDSNKISRFKPIDAFIIGVYAGKSVR